MQLSDPLGDGSDLLGTAGWQVRYWHSERPTLLAVVKVLAVVIGQVLGGVSAQDRAVRWAGPVNLSLGVVADTVVAAESATDSSSVTVVHSAFRWDGDCSGGTLRPRVVAAPTGGGQAD